MRVQLFWTLQLFPFLQWIPFHDRIRCVTQRDEEIRHLIDENLISLSLSLSFSIVQYSTVLCHSVLLYSTVQYSAVLYRTDTGSTVYAYAYILCTCTCACTPRAATIGFSTMHYYCCCTIYETVLYCTVLSCPVLCSTVCGECPWLLHLIV